MSGYTDPTGGAPVGVAAGGYTSFSLSASIVLQWPQYAVNGQPFARLMDVTPTALNLSVSLPDATLVGAGEACIVNNKGAYAFSLLDNAGNILAVVQPSEVRYCYLMDNSTVAGLWSLVLFGRSNSAQDASQFVGPGLKAINNTLAWAPVTTLIGGSTVLDSTHRSKVIVYTGGAGTVSLPDLATVGNDFVCEFRNQGSGVATLQPANTQTIDGSASATFNVNESCLIHASSAGWVTVGRGRSVQFAFTQLVKNIAGGGGTTTLSLSEASSVIQNYIGALTGGQFVVVPAVVQVYYASNQTTGGNNVTFKTASPGGSTVTLSPGQNAVLFCDGTNVINANTTTSGLTSLVLGAGSAGSPTISVGTAGNGLYAPGTNQIGLTLNGAAFVTWSAGAVSTVAPTLAHTLTASSGAVSLILDRISGQTGSMRVRTAGVDRFAFEVSNVAESGGNVGSDLSLNAYNDAGSAGNVVTYNRNSRVASYTFLPSAAGAPLVNTSAVQTLQNKTIDGAQNTLRNINLATSVVGVLSAANGGTGGIANTLYVGRLWQVNGGAVGPSTINNYYRSSGGQLTFVVNNATGNRIQWCDLQGATDSLGGLSYFVDGTYLMLSAGYATYASLWTKIA